MTLKERLENNLVMVVLGSLVTGFLAGFGTYKTMLEVQQLEPISRPKLAELQARPLSCPPTVAPPKPAPPDISTTTATANSPATDTRHPPDTDTAANEIKRRRAEVARHLKGVWVGTIIVSADSNLRVKLDFSSCPSANGCSVVVRNQEPAGEMYVFPRRPVSILADGVIEFYLPEGPAQRHPNNPCPKAFRNQGGDFKVSLQADNSLLGGDVVLHDNHDDPCRGTFSMERTSL